MSAVYQLAYTYHTSPESWLDLTPEAIADHVMRTARMLKQIKG